MTVTVPIDAFLRFSAALTEIHAAGTIPLEVPATEPPELAVSWLFSFRAALPPRAPSAIA